MANVLGVILAGGLSRRMEGPEKSLLKLGDDTLVSHVANQLKQQTSEIILNANGDASRFSQLRLEIQPDTVEGFVGPLAGVLAGMRWAGKNSDATHLITAAADTPFFPQNYVTEMLSQQQDQNAEIALASSNGRRHPTFGLWPVKLADALEQFLVDEGNRKVMLFVERYKNCKVDFDILKNDLDPFFNVNTPDDMKTAEHHMTRQQTT